jgi:hypothetical protein
VTSHKNVKDLYVDSNDRAKHAFLCKVEHKAFDFRNLDAVRANESLMNVIVRRFLSERHAWLERQIQAIIDAKKRAAVIDLT